MRKAQLFSMDIIFAIASFILILLTVAVVWDNSHEKIINTEARNDLELLSHRAFSLLLNSPGNPENWTTLQAADFNASNLLSLGIAKSCSSNNLDQIEKAKSCGITADSSLQLDSSKISYLDTNDASLYSAYKTILGISGPNYEFLLQIRPFNGTGYSAAYTIGSAPLNATNVVNMERFALLNNQWTLVNMQVWRHG